MPMTFDRPTADELRAMMKAAFAECGRNYLNEKMDITIQRRMSADLNGWVHAVGSHRYPRHYRWPLLVCNADLYRGTVNVEWERVRFEEDGSVTYLDDLDAEMRANYEQAMKDTDEK